VVSKWQESGSTWFADQLKELRDVCLWFVILKQDMGFGEIGEGVHEACWQMARFS
jgi:hypothetical protein